MAIFPLAPDQTIAQMWSNGAQGGIQYDIIEEFNVDRPVLSGILDKL